MKSQPARGLSLRSGTVDRVSDDSIFQNLTVASISSILGLKAAAFSALTLGASTESNLIQG